jgi:hypothetical protein
VYVHIHKYMWHFIKIHTIHIFDFIYTIFLSSKKTSYSNILYTFYNIGRISTFMHCIRSCMKQNEARHKRPDFLNLLDQKTWFQEVDGNKNRQAHTYHPRVVQSDIRYYLDVVSKRIYISKFKSRNQLRSFTLYPNEFRDGVTPTVEKTLDPPPMISWIYQWKQSYQECYRLIFFFYSLLETFTNRGQNKRSLHYTQGSNMT